MSDIRQEATITVPVDPSNPGEFLACCGLLELAHRLTAPDCRALGWFSRPEGKDGKFSISAFEEGAPITLERVLDSLGQCRIKEENSDSKEGPVFLEEPFNLTLDWRSPFPQNGKIKTFAGPQRLFDVFQTLQQAVQTVGKAELSDTPLFGIFKKTLMNVTAFGVEKAENAIDAGFSFDKHKDGKIKLVRITPIFLEILALIGAQRFCPGELQKLERVYFSWYVPLTAPLAAIVSSIPFETLPQEGFVFQMYKRDSKGRYKGFSPARKVKITKGGYR